ncbi:hypothetical protein J6590_104998, partial [Homalodisca vitripennis]
DPFYTELKESLSVVFERDNYLNLITVGAGEIAALSSRLACPILLCEPLNGFTSTKGWFTSHKRRIKQGVKK